MADRAADEVPDDGLERAVEEPGDRDEGGGEVGRGDGHDAEEGDRGARVSARPEVDGDVGER